jgi:hypothetical protein
MKNGGQSAGVGFPLLAQPYAFFENIWERFIETEQSALPLGSHNGKVMGGTFYLE